jgi:hypothetical protein
MEQEVAEPDLIACPDEDVRLAVEPPIELLVEVLHRQTVTV